MLSKETLAGVARKWHTENATKRETMEQSYHLRMTMFLQTPEAHQRMLEEASVGAPYVNFVDHIARHPDDSQCRIFNQWLWSQKASFDFDVDSPIKDTQFLKQLASGESGDNKYCSFAACWGGNCGMYKADYWEESSS